MTQYVYGVIECVDDVWSDTIIPDSAEPNIESAYSWFMQDDDAVWMKVVKLNPDDFWRGWFYYNDMESHEDACELECNTREHLDMHWEINNSSGHYDCTHYEHIVNGEVVETIKHVYQDFYE